MTPSSCPWRTRARGPNSAGSPASGRCTSSAGPGSRWPTRTSSPGCATRTWRTMRTEPRPLRSRMGESAPGQGQVTCPAGIPSLTPQPFSTFSPAETPDLEFLITPSPLSASIPEEHAAVVPAPSPTTPSLLPRLSLGPNGLQGFQPNVHPQLPVVLQHRQQHHPALLPRLLQLDSAPFDPEEPPGSAGLLPAPAARAGEQKSNHSAIYSLSAWSQVQRRLISPLMEVTVLILIAVGLEVAPSPGVSSAIFFVPGFLLLVPGVYHVIFIYCAVKGHRGFQFFYLPYFEK
ncbi:transmembrane protein 134 isoform X1 [Neovison vison]|uniref:transmembrane protein 134 isoform X1 n=1 Tax=Neovison vison TaxID=452646 RepID=UPI001CF0BDE4|nr:transmembrane protein 134 isoform X1 [Neogale vison]